MQRGALLLATNLAIVLVLSGTMIVAELTHPPLAERIAALKAAQYLSIGELHGTTH